MNRKLGTKLARKSSSLCCWNGSWKGILFCTFQFVTCAQFAPFITSHGMQGKWTCWNPKAFFKSCKVMIPSLIVYTNYLTLLTFGLHSICEWKNNGNWIMKNGHLWFHSNRGWNMNLKVKLSVLPIESNGGSFNWIICLLVRRIRRLDFPQGQQ
jgi:hypothetical protein